MQNRYFFRDFPTWREPATTSETQTALSLYDAAIFEADALIMQARNTYRRVWESHLEAYRRQLVHERAIWNDALLRVDLMPRRTLRINDPALWRPAPAQRRAQ